MSSPTSGKTSPMKTASSKVSAASRNATSAPTGACASKSRDVLTGAIALGALAFCAIMNCITCGGRTNAPHPDVLNERFNTPFSPSAWVHMLWSVCHALIGLYLVSGLVRALRGKPIRAFSCAATMIAPALAMNSLVTYLWGKDLLLLPTLLVLGGAACALVCYYIVMRVTGNAGACAVPPPPAGCANPSAEPLVNNNTTESEGACSPRQCATTLVQTLWARVYAPWMIVVALQFVFIFSKFSIFGHTPASVSSIAGNQTIANKITGAFVHNVGGLSTAITTQEAIGTLAMLFALVLIAIVFSAKYVDSVPSLVFAWWSLGIACHARKSSVAAAAHVSNTGMYAFLNRLSGMLDRVGVHGVWGLGGSRGEHWWTVVFDVAIAVSIVLGLIAAGTMVIKCRKAQALRGKTLG